MAEGKTKPPSLLLLTSKEIFILPLRTNVSVKTFREHLQGQERQLLAKGVCIAKLRGETWAPVPSHMLRQHKLHKPTAPCTVTAPRWHGNESRHAGKRWDQVMEGVGDLCDDSCESQELDRAQISKLCKNQQTKEGKTWTSPAPSCCL